MFSVLTIAAADRVDDDHVMRVKNRIILKCLINLFYVEFYMLQFFLQYFPLNIYNFRDMKKLKFIFFYFSKISIVQITKPFRT